MVGGIQTAMNNLFAKMSYGEQGPHRQAHTEQQKVRPEQDAVVLSGNIPEPFGATEILAAGDIAADALEGTDKASASATARLRMDRVFAALAVLNVMQADDTGMRISAMGIPAPTEAELDAAYRRLTQHVRNDTGGETGSGVGQAREQRRVLVETFRGADFGAIAASLARGADADGMDENASPADVLMEQAQALS